MRLLQERPPPPAIHPDVRVIRAARMAHALRRGPRAQTFDRAGPRPGPPRAVDPESFVHTAELRTVGARPGEARPNGFEVPDRDAPFDQLPQ